MSACNCHYTKNLKEKCGQKSGLACRQLYLPEREACEGHCITDWP